MSVPRLTDPSGKPENHRKAELVGATPQAASKNVPAAIAKYYNYTFFIIHWGTQEFLNH